MLSRLKALELLSECRGDEIWSVTYCASRAVPDEWIEELADCFESGFRFDRDTIYVENRPVNQYAGVRDRDLAIRLAEFLGVDAKQATISSWSPLAEVAALKEAVDEV